MKILESDGMIIDGGITNKGQEALTNNDKKRMYKKLTKEPELSAPEVRSKTKIKASPRTISRKLRKQGYREKSIFLDESSFQAYTKRKFCYQKPDQRITNPRPKYPPTIHLIALISWWVQVGSSYSTRV